MEKIYQTIIIGGGPAGLIAGRYLNNALILEKGREIGEFFHSGEGISEKSLKRLEINPEPSFISCRINFIQRIMPNGKAFGRVHENLGYIINGIQFLKSLTDKCSAEIQLNSEVVNIEKENDFWKVITKDGRIFKSKFLIGADGANSIVRRKFFIGKLKILPAIQYLVELNKQIDSSVAKIYFDNEKFPQGYAWIFPKSNKTANVGIGGEGDLSKKFEDFLEEVVRKNYEGFKMLQNRSGIIPFGGAQSDISKENIFLVGDAAGLADPIFLGGINQAMSSGKIAAQCILGNEFNLYEKRIKSMPFADPRLIKTREIFYSLPNQVLNELGEVLEGKGSSYFRTIPGILKTLSKPNLRKNLLKLFQFFSIWLKNRDCLW